MSPSEVVDGAKAKLKAAIAHFEIEITKLRTGRAHPSMLDGVSAEAYGQQMPLIQLATIATPESQLIQVTPFDPSNIQAISSAIRDNQSLGMNPMDDGRVVRVPIPPLTEERRKQIVKQLGEKVEDCNIAIRNIRHETLKQLDQAKKDKDISEDEHKRATKQVDDTMAETKKEIERLSTKKEAEIMTV
jgi:ribosome recycling factor